MAAQPHAPAERRTALADLAGSIARAEERRATYLGILERQAPSRREARLVRGMLHLAEEDPARLRQRLERLLGSR